MAPDPDDVVDEWHDGAHDGPDGNISLIEYLMRRMDWTRERTERWIKTGR